MVAAGVFYVAALPFFAFKCYVVVVGAGKFYVLLLIICMTKGEVYAWAASFIGSYV